VGSFLKVRRGVVFVIGVIGGLGIPGDEDGFLLIRDRRDWTVFFIELSRGNLGLLRGFISVLEIFPISKPALWYLGLIPGVREPASDRGWC
jgi:hypothetical protein